jgi:arylsulfatase A-like enzyme/tetratricopeptide (TPR) repeat protein
MKKKLVFLVPLLLVLAFGIFLLLRKGGKGVAPNVLIITLDTTRADRIGAYGYRRAQTPNIDRLALEGTLFENCSSCAPLTLPAHCSLFTGLYPIAHNVRNNGRYFLNPSEGTLAEALKAGGYRTYAVIAAFVLLSKFGLGQGFDFYDDTLNPYEMEHNYKSEIPADQVYAKFSRWFGQNQGEKFFAWVHFYDPHDPYSPPPEVAKRFKNDARGRYDGEIANADLHVGKIIADLQARGALDNTLLLVVGDHGEAFGEHQEHGHPIFCYRENLHVPLILRHPRLIAKGKKVSAPVDLTDIMPTVLELLDLKVPAAVQGRSLLPLLNGDDAPAERTFYFESMYGREEMNWAPLTGIVQNDFKYISLPEPELYDLQKDSQEKANLFKKKNILARDLDKKLARFIAANSRQGGKTNRELSESDKEELQALGYISSFSKQAAQSLDPKQGILVSNRLKGINNLLKKKDVEQAEKDMQALLKEYPQVRMPLIHNMLYKLFMLKRDSAAAMNCLLDGITLFPDVDQFRISLALTLFDMKRYDKAEKRCRELIAMNPNSTRAIILLGEIREKQNRPAEAIEFYAQALKLEPQNISLKVKYAELLLAGGKYAQAVSVYNQVLENEDAGDKPELLLKVALLNIKYGTWEQAEKLLARAVAIKPEGKFFFNYALILAKNGKIEQALANMETAAGRHASELTAEQLKTAEKALAAWK